MLRVGGVYADVDTECRQPMDEVLRSNDSMVVGWENEFESPAEAEHRHYVRSRQARARPYRLCSGLVLCPDHVAACRCQHIYRGFGCHQSHPLRSRPG